MSSERTLLYLTDADVSALDLDARSVRIAIENAFRAYAAGTLRCEPKTSIAIGPGHAFQSLAAVDTQRGFAAVKWIGMVPPGGAANVNINASILLSDTASGQLLSLMDARRATALRTAGMTAVAAQFLARTDSRTIGFVGAGVQAEGHLAALAAVLPSLHQVLVNSRTAATAERFAQHCRDVGYEASVASARETLEGSDIVVTTVPLRSNFEPFLDAAWIRCGAFVAAVDLGRSWKQGGLGDVEMAVVDDEAMKHYAKPGNFVPPLGYAHATLADLVSKRHAGRTSGHDRVMFFSSGSGVADLAIAMLIYERALAQKVGTPLKN
jgi:ornithine cyclodeaminase/alanine dehydrogenase-like protein (mu-crystallin family)